jgi:high-affinity iron transporter
MLAVAIVVFREVLEAALIVGIVMAASRGVAGRGKWVTGGVIAGIFGACLVAGFAETIAEAASGVGQELLNAAIMFLAVVMLGWHNVWMSKHGREMAAAAASVGAAVTSGARPLTALALVVGMASLREGSELVLFLYSIAAAGGGGAVSMLGGGTIGLAAGASFGVALYLGLLRIPTRHLFAVTSWLILLLAAGLASQGAAFLVQADLLPTLGSGIWDTSRLLSEASIPGKVLHVLIGYVARPDGIQIVFWLTTLAVIAVLMRLVGGGAIPFDRGARRAISVALLSLLALGLGAVAARADFQVRSPIIDYLEVELEHNGAYSHDRDPAKNHAQSYTNSVGYGLTPWWATEIEGEWAADPGSNLRYGATTWENRFQFTEQGKYWIDLGGFAEYSHSPSRLGPDSVTFGPLAQIEQGDLLHTVNLLAAKDIGHGSSGVWSLLYAAQSRWRLNHYFEPGIEAYGTIGDVSVPGEIHNQDHRAGPVAVGYAYLFGSTKLKYEVGYLFGLTTPTPTGTVRWKLELETHF